MKSNSYQRNIDLSNDDLNAAIAALLGWTVEEQDGDLVMTSPSGARSKYRPASIPEDMGQRMIMLCRYWQLMWATDLNMAWSLLDSYAERVGLLIKPIYDAKGTARMICELWVRDRWDM